MINTKMKKHPSTLIKKTCVLYNNNARIIVLSKLNKILFSIANNWENIKIKIIKKIENLYLKLKKILFINFLFIGS